MIIAFRSPQGNEIIFNTFHSKGRIIIERTIGVLKNRFKCLLGARQLHYSPEVATQIVNCCAALHNMCIAYRVEDIEDEVEENTDNEVIEQNEIENEDDEA